MDINTIQNLLLPLFGKLPLLFCMIVFSILFILATYCIFDLEKFRFKQKNLREQKELLLKTEQNDIVKQKLHEINTKIRPAKNTMVTRYLCVLTLCCTGIISVTCFCLFQKAYNHGYREYTKHNINEIIHAVKNTPVEDTLPENLENIIVVYYRFGCNDCNLLYNELSACFSEINDVYWIATRSKQGKHLREQFPVENVPSALFIKNETTAVTFDLYTKRKINDSITISPNTKNIQKLLEFRIQHMKGD